MVFPPSNRTPTTQSLLFQGHLRTRFFLCITLPLRRVRIVLLEYTGSPAPIDYETRSKFTQRRNGHRKFIGATARIRR